MKIDVSQPDISEILQQLIASGILSRVALIILRQKSMPLLQRKRHRFYYVTSSTLARCTLDIAPGNIRHHPPFQTTGHIHSLPESRCERISKALSHLERTVIENNLQRQER